MPQPARKKASTTRTPQQERLPRPAPVSPPALNLQLADAASMPKPMGAARAAPPAWADPERPASGLDLRAPVSDRWWMNARLVDNGDRHPEPGLTVGVKLKF